MKRAKVKYDRVCPNCNTPFVATRRTRLYCKDKCKMEHWRKLNPSGKSD